MKNTRLNVCPQCGGSGRVGEDEWPGGNDCPSCWMTGLRNHERNVLVWLVAQPSRLCLLAVALLALALSGCNLVESPTATRVPHPNEVEVQELTQCIGDYFAKKNPGFSVTSEITETRRVVPCLDPNATGECVAKGWAMLPGNKVIYWGPWVRGEYEPLHEWSLEMLAAHEVCHVFWLTTNEAAADLCAGDVWLKAGCHPATAITPHDVLGATMQTSAPINLGGER